MESMNFAYNLGEQTPIALQAFVGETWVMRRYDEKGFKPVNFTA